MKARQSTDRGVRFLTLLSGAGLLLLALTLASAAEAQSQACRVQPAPIITVTAEIPEPKIITHLPRETVSRLPGRNAQRPIGLPWRLDGLTVYRFVTSHEIEVRQSSRRRDCFRINRIKVAITFDHLDVYIVRELKSGTCRHRVTLSHEFDHVAVVRQGIARLETELRAVLAASSAFGVTRARDIQAALRRYGDAAGTVIGDVRLRVVDDMNRRNRELDTPSNYRALERRCQG